MVGDAGPGGRDGGSRGTGPPDGRGRLVVVATPIGNLSDLSPRAADTLRDAGAVAAEDTRRARVLLDHIGARVPVISYHEHNEERRGPQLLERVAAGEVVALISDAGTPGVADPGYRLVRDAAARGLAVEAVPGPVAAIHALVVSGLPTDRFAFEGFLPRKAAARRRRLAQLATEPRTLLFYVAPHRAAADLEAMAEAFGDRQAAVARELTKLHEEVWRGTLPELARRAAGEVRGELTVVVAPAGEDAAERPGDDELVRRVRDLVATGLTKKEALAQVAGAAGLPRREVYQALLDAGSGS